MTSRNVLYRLTGLAVLFALFYASDWMRLRVLQRDAIEWSFRASGYTTYSFFHEGSPGLAVQGKVHYYTPACTYLDLLMIGAPFAWVFGARRRSNIQRIGIGALVILSVNFVRCWAAVYLDVLGVDRFYAHDLPHYIIWGPTVAIVALLAARRDLQDRFGATPKAVESDPGVSVRTSEVFAR